MLNPKYEESGNVLTFEEYAAMENKDPHYIGKRVITNAPGRTGHNYAYWEVFSVAVSPLDADKVIISARRTRND